MAYAEQRNEKIAFFHSVELNPGYQSLSGRCRNLWSIVSVREQDVLESLTVVQPHGDVDDMLHGN
ncbi:hypothetical protein [Bradyrhizobium sp. Leo121]|uniref:hypothetical protein n=1 Tax=Bradyrhizobium sp. Leo121 TaxID=1571195 RepID=UPI0010293FB0|nr:hypothetical protein [Bradyrhizobium sp. Leo121]